MTAKTSKFLEAEDAPGVGFSQDESALPVEPVNWDVEVVVINWDLGDAALVRSTNGKFRILNKELLVNTYGAQSIPLHAFNDGIIPYDWEDEIKRVALTPDQMCEILYAQGYVIKAELSLPELTKQLLVRGKIPVTTRR